MDKWQVIQLKLNKTEIRNPQQTYKLKKKNNQKLR